jgi:hypothetical protein
VPVFDFGIRIGDIEQKEGMGNDERCMMNGE